VKEEEELQEKKERSAAETWTVVEGGTTADVPSSW
jgi:hypothetical protein